MTFSEIWIKIQNFFQENAFENAVITLFMPQCVNIIRLRQNSCDFADDNSIKFPSMKIFAFQLEFYWNLFQGVQLTISQY